MNVVEEKVNCLHCGKPQTELTRLANREIKNWETK